jgi:hypothetical protein
MGTTLVQPLVQSVMKLEEEDDGGVVSWDFSLRVAAMRD